MIRAIGILVGAAVLETGGIALVRKGLEHRDVPLTEAWLLAAGAAALVAYGLLVNQGGLNFGRLMGVYIATFFVVSQVMAALVFHQVPAIRTLLGGGLIVAGGITILC